MKIKSKLIIGFSLMVIVTIFLGIITNSQSNFASDDFKFLIENNFVVTQNAEKLLTLVTSSEVKQRSFIISGDVFFLESYLMDVENFYALLEIEKILISDNPLQVQKLEYISELFSEWINFSATPEIELATKIHQTQQDDLELLLSTNSGKVILDEIYSIIVLLKENMRITDNVDGFLLLNKIDNDIKDSESAQRGYLITGKDEFLISFDAIKTELHENIQNLEINLTANTENLQLIYSVDKLYQKWEQEIVIPEFDSRRLIEQYPNLNQLALLIQEGTGTQIIDEIKIQFDEFIKTEETLTNKRFENALSSQEFIRYIIFTILIISVSIAAIMSFLIFNSITHSLSKLEKIIQKFKDGQFNEKLDIVSNDELGEFSRSFDSIRDMLLKKEKLQNIGDLASRLAHDLRNPLSVIQGASHLIENTIDKDDDTKKRFTMIRTAINRMTHQLNDVMDFVRVIDLHIENVSLLELLKSTLLEIDIPKSMQIQIPQNNILLKCDPIKLKIVFVNLILNAIDTVNVDIIKIRFIDSELFIKIEVEDSGPEIPLDVMKNMFEPLFTTRTSGTGLGLASCKNIIEQHGGQISVTSSPTIFTITLPKINS